ncbi:MAG: hypothetical protein PVF58_18450 [Candidatus Methanofastidiosia archaeon]|jgi:hypothetical protein
MGISLHENDSRKIARSGIFDVLDFVSSCVFIFKTNFFCIFRPIVTHYLEPFLITKGNLLFSGIEEKKVDGWKCLKKDVSGNPFGIHPIDQYTGRFNPLMHVVLMDENLPKNEKMYLLSAIDRGYPFISIKDLPHKRSTPFTRSLKTITGYLMEKNISVFLKISEVLVKDEFDNKEFLPSTNSILLILENLPQKTARFLSEDRPEIYIKSLYVHFIIPFRNNKDLKYFVKVLSGLKEKLKLNSLETTTLNVGKMDQSKYCETGSLRYNRYRIMANFHFTNKDLLPIHCITDFLEELENYITGNSLKMVDKISYNRFMERNKEKEFWIKGARVAVILPIKFISIARKVIIDHFVDSLTLSFGSQAIVIKELKRGLAELVFDIRFPRARDYFVSKREFGLFFGKFDRLDRWTAIGIEHAMMRDFANAEKFLERARIALEADLDVLESYKLEYKEQKQKLREAGKKYQEIGIICPDCPTKTIYLIGSSKEEIKRKIKENENWKTSLSLYMEGISIKKQILDDHVFGKKRWTMMKKANRCIRDSGLVPIRDNVDFENDLSNFYAALLSLIQQNYGDYTPKWFGFVR